jgi:hypothetical protein
MNSSNLDFEGQGLSGANTSVKLAFLFFIIFTPAFYNFIHCVAINDDIASTPTLDNLDNSVMDSASSENAKSVRREGNYRDSSIHNWSLYVTEDDEEAQPFDEYEAYLQEKLLPLPEDDTRTAGMLLDYWRGKEKT